jgi:ArsR family transcriptional regulator, arsenate/arsenite/antimonite-responsive transcriptional repressor
MNAQAAPAVLCEEEQMALTNALPDSASLDDLQPLGPQTIPHPGEPPPGNLPTTNKELTNLPATTMQDLVQLFKLLADETRLKILNYLMQTEEMNVRTLCGLVTQSQPAVSHHLALLKDAGLIECRRAGKHNFYRLVTQRCQSYLDGVFGVTDGEVRKVRVEKAVLTYAHEALSAESPEER